MGSVDLAFLVLTAHSELFALVVLGVLELAVVTVRTEVGVAPTEPGG